MHKVQHNEKNLRTLVSDLKLIVQLKTYQQPATAPIYVDRISPERLPPDCEGVAVKFSYMPSLPGRMIDDIRAALVGLGYECLYIRYNAAKHSMQSVPGMRFAFYVRRG